jgi:hypothetical protein
VDQQGRMLHHQIHPLKLLSDGCAEVASLPLFWQHRLRLALVAHFVPPALASLALMRWAELEPFRGSAFGRYVAQWMTPRTQALRLLGDLVMVGGPRVASGGSSWRVRSWSYSAGFGVGYFPLKAWG